MRRKFRCAAVLLICTMLRLPAGIARKEEIAKLAAGEDFDLFDRDATAFFEEGTKENPIVILSNEPTRIVGMSLEVRFSIPVLMSTDHYHGVQVAGRCLCAFLHPA